MSTFSQDNKNAKAAGSAVDKDNPTAEEIAAADASTGAGAEVEKPVAIVVSGGLITAALLTLFVLPAISHLLLRGRHKKHVPGDYSDVSVLGEPIVDK